MSTLITCPGFGPRCGGLQSPTAAKPSRYKVWMVSDTAAGEPTTVICTTSCSDTAQRQEILDWYHLMENLHKVGGYLTRFHLVRTLLCQGKVDAAIQQFTNCTLKSATNFIAYLTKHRHRIPNYQYLQLEGFTIGSGAVESAVKQIIPI